MCSIEIPANDADANLPLTARDAALGPTTNFDSTSQPASTGANADGGSSAMPRIRRKNLQEQFWARFERRGDDECWPWTGQLQHKGYGFGWFRFGDFVTRSAHRASWIIHRGSPGDLHVLHSCDNRRCVNPKHLFLGTNADNMADMRAKGRSAKGPKQAKARLTDDKVRAIKASSDRTCDLARRYRVSYGTVAAIRHGRSWGHIKCS